MNNYFPFSHWSCVQQLTNDVITASWWSDNSYTNLCIYSAKQETGSYCSLHDDMTITLLFYSYKPIAIVHEYVEFVNTRVHFDLLRFHKSKCILWCWQNLPMAWDKANPLTKAKVSSPMVQSLWRVSTMWQLAIPLAHLLDRVGWLFEGLQRICLQATMASVSSAFRSQASPNWESALSCRIATSPSHLLGSPTNLSSGKK